MAEPTVQQRIAQLEQQIRDIGPTYRNITSGTSALGNLSPTGAGFVTGRKQATSPEVRRLQAEIDQLMRQFTPTAGRGSSPLESLATASRSAGFNNERQTQKFQRALEASERQNLGQMAVSVPMRARAVPIERLASNYGMTLTEFLQMNPQYAGRETLTGGEVVKVLGTPSDLGAQLEAQQMRYEANVPTDAMRLLSDPDLLSGVQGDAFRVSELARRVRGRNERARELAAAEGIDVQEARSRLNAELGTPLSREQRTELRDLRGQIRAEVPALFQGLGNLPQLAGRRVDQTRVLRQILTGRDPNLQPYMQAAQNLVPLTEEQAQEAFVQQTGTLPEAMQQTVQPPPAPVGQPQQATAQPVTYQNWYEAPMFQFQQPQQYQPVPRYQTQPQQPMFQFQQPQQYQQPFFGGFQQPQQYQQPFFGGFQQPSAGASNVFGGLGSLGPMAMGGSGII
jgi:hypothetical protein